MARHWYWLFPLLAVVLYTPYSAAWDLSVSSYFFHEDHFTPSTLDQYIYKVGELPGLALGALSIIVWCGSYVLERWRRWRMPAAAIALAFILGPGLLVNVVLKDHWGRPRPRQIEQFGGKEAFQPFYKPSFIESDDNHKSFPSGHVTMGFFFLVLALVARREGYDTLCWGSVIFAVGLGVLLAMTRIAQGGHFLSDTILAAVLMWFVALFSVRVVYGPSHESKYAM